MRVEIDDRNALRAMGGARMLRADCGIVENAEAHRRALARMMSGRARCDESVRRFSAHHRVNRRNCAPPPHALPPPASRGSSLCRHPAGHDRHAAKSSRCVRSSPRHARAKACRASRAAPRVAPASRSAAHRVRRKSRVIFQRGLDGRDRPGSCSSAAGWEIKRVAGPAARVRLEAKAAAPTRRARRDGFAEFICSSLAI